MEQQLITKTDFSLKPLNPDTTVAEYIWLGGSGQDMRSKTMVTYFVLIQNIIIFYGRLSPKKLLL